MSAFPHASPASRNRFRRALSGGALVLLLGVSAACTPAAGPEPDSGGTSSSETATAATTGADAGTQADCPALTATVPGSNARDGRFTGGDAPALDRSDGGTSAVHNATITQSGGSAAAAVQVSGGSRLSLRSSTVGSTGAGTGGVSSTGTGSLVELADTTVSTDGTDAPALRADDGGAVTGSDLTLSTTREDAGAVSSRGGEITLNRSTASAAGASAAVYSAGDISVCGLSGSSRSAEAAVVEGANTLTSTGSELTGATHGVHLLQAGAGQPDGGTLTVSGGSLRGQSGDSVLVDGVPATVSLSAGAQLSAGSGTLINAVAGGAGTVNVTETELNGNLAAEPGSSLQLSLTANSAVTGTLTNVGVSLDTTSQISLQGDSTASGVAGALVSGNEVTNITGNGHRLTYDPSDPDNGYLNGGTYDLEQGGTLTPR